MTDAVDNSTATDLKAGAGEEEPKEPIVKEPEVKAPEIKEPEKKEPEKKEPEKKPEAPKVPEKYDLKTPEGSKLSAQDVEEIASHCKERGFSQDQAQAQVERESKLKEGFEKQSLAQLESATKEWLETSKADKEIGGEEFPKHAELAKRVVTRFGTPEFKKELERTGLGNHPELVRVFVRIGKAMSDDQLIMPGSQTKQPRDVAEKFYGSEKKE